MNGDEDEPTIALSSVLQWLRNCSDAFGGCQPADPSEVVDALADRFRDAWLEAAADELEVQ